MKFAFEILKIGSDPLFELDEKREKAKKLINEALKEFETTLFFIEETLREIIEKAV
ncbi:MAG: hypothetical protein QXF61_07920 [Nitrososphaeria archaeon]